MKTPDTSLYIASRVIVADRVSTSTVLRKPDIAVFDRNANQISPAHSCEDCTVKADNGEMVCIRCGRVDEEGTMREAFEARSETEDKATSSDHNAGNGLLNSQTAQSKYVSRRNPGLAMGLNNVRGKDAFGKGIKPQLRDPYKSGLLADPTVGFRVDEDPLTGEKKVKFSMYDAPLLPILKEQTYQICIDMGLDVVQQTRISKNLKRLYSNLFINGPFARYAVIASLLNNKHDLKKQQIVELERELAATIEEMREKVLSGCRPKIPNS